MEKYAYRFVCPLDVGFLGKLDSILAIEPKPIEIDPLEKIVEDLKTAGIQPNPDAPNTF